MSLGAIVRATKPATTHKPEASAASDSGCGVTAYCTPTEQADDPNSTVSEAKSAVGSNCG
ncbi:hypothetical protein ABT009_37970 [Streptomyces sp. NPDC002896]|uniref:hypothetical protein n=1 Tax=Streptomyces sp. NPDC002896 TaxID=3154438 RepID=UPI003332CE0B